MIAVNNTTNHKIEVELIKKITAKFLRINKISNKEVSIAIVGDSEIKKINHNYRGQNKTTDVLSFSGEGNFLGEIIIDYSQIKRQARQSKKTTKQELVFILVHGLLHLAGYNDETERERLEMIKRGEGFIKRLENNKI